MEPVRFKVFFWVVLSFKNLNCKTGDLDRQNDAKRAHWRDPGAFQAGVRRDDLVRMRAPGRANHYALWRWDRGWHRDRAGTNDVALNTLNSVIEDFDQSPVSDINRKLTDLQGTNYYDEIGTHH